MVFAKTLNQILCLQMETDTVLFNFFRYTLLCGHPPFETTSLRETYQRIITNKYTVPLHVSIAANGLISALLTSDPHKRITLEKMASDEFFTSGYMPPTLATFCCHTAPRFPFLQLEQNRYVCVCECACARVRVCVRACVCACVRACVHACVCVCVTTLY